MNKVNFTKWIGETLVPRLRCGNIVVMDNLRSHHGSEVREAIEAVGASIKFLLEPSIKPSQPPKPPTIAMITTKIPLGAAEK